MSYCRKPGATPRVSTGRICCCQPRPGAKKRAPSPIPNAASVGCALPCQHRVKRVMTGRSRATLRIVWARPWTRWQGMATPPACFPGTARRTSMMNIAPRPAVAIWISPAWTTHVWNVTARSNGLIPNKPNRAASGSIRTASSRLPMAGRNLYPHRLSAPGRASIRNGHCISTAGDCGISGTA